MFNHFQKEVEQGAVQRLELLREDVLPAFSSPARLAEHLGIPTERLGDILAGRAPVDEHVADGLACVFGNSPEFWLSLQRRYDERRGHQHA